MPVRSFDFRKPQYPFGVMFHHFHGGGHPEGQGSISADQLESIIEGIGPHRIVTPDQWIQGLKSNSLNSESVCLTFDDNLRCQFDVALPVLNRYGIKAFWFVYTSIFENIPGRLEIYRYFRTVNFETVDEFYEAFLLALKSGPFAEKVNQGLVGFVPETYLKESCFYSREDRVFRFVRDQILGEAAYFEVIDEMIAKANFTFEFDQLWMNEACLLNLASSGHHIGLHSHTHPTSLSKKDAAGQEFEFFQNFRKLKEITGNSPEAVSYPCNSYNSSTLDAIKKLGVEIGFRANLEKLKGTNLELPRIDHVDLLACL